VPTAAVIPAPMAYLPIVAVEALVATVPTAVPLMPRGPFRFADLDPCFPTLRNATCKPRTVMRLQLAVGQDSQVVRALRGRYLLIVACATGQPAPWGER